MKHKKVLFNFAFKTIFFVLAFVLIFTIPKISVSYGDNFELIYKSFVGEKCEYQGFIEVWNIDTFEGGKRAKTDLLKEFANLFQKKYRGVFVMVRNLLPNECIGLLKSGECPDLFSCSVGFADEIEEYVQPFIGADTSMLFENYSNSGECGDEQVALAWCSGAYFLISTSDKLNSTKADVEGKKLSEIIFDLGYEKKIAKKTKTIYSVGFGSGDYICPKNCLKEYNEMKELPNFAMDDGKQISTYSAYAEFLAGEYSVLLGTQRDIIRIDGRIKANKISNVIVEPVKKYNDLVQYFFLSKDENVLKAKYAQKFAEFMLTARAQEEVALSGLISTRKGLSIEPQNSVMSNITYEIIGNYELKCVFE